jgi:hypothetical protein
MGITFPMKLCILKNAASAGFVGIPGAFFAHGDIPVLAGIWTNMFFRLAKHANRNLDMKTAGRLALTTATALSVAATGVKVMNTVVAHTGLGAPFAMAANASANAGATYLIGTTAADLLIKNKLTAIDLINAVIAGLGLSMGNSELQSIIDKTPNP